MFRWVGYIKYQLNIISIESILDHPLFYNFIWVKNIINAYTLLTNDTTDFNIVYALMIYSGS